MQLKYLNPISIVNEKKMFLANMQDKLEQLIKNALNADRHRLEVYISRLKGVSPLEKLSQGYSYTEYEDGRKISGVGELEKGQKLNIYFSDGKVKALIEEVINGEITNS